MVAMVSSVRPRASGRKWLPGKQNSS